MNIVSAEQIKVWEKKYTKVHTIVFDEVKDDKGKIIEEGKKAYLRQPDRFTIKMAMSKQIKVSGDNIDTISPGEVIINNCWLGGDSEMKTDDFYYFRLCTAASKIMSEVTGFLQRR